VQDGGGGTWLFDWLHGQFSTKEVLTTSHDGQFSTKEALTTSHVISVVHDENVYSVKSQSSSELGTKSHSNLHPDSARLRGGFDTILYECSRTNCYVNVFN
jgi:hypothetical protein